MTAQEKAAMAAFLDLSSDYLTGGYKRTREEYSFNDDLTFTSSLRASVPLCEENPKNATVSPCEEKPENTPVYVKMPPTCDDPTDDSLEAIAAEIASCKRCGLCKTRTNTVPGEGVTKPLVMVIGEGPGEDEDRSGRPFVGRAGQLLDRMLDSKGKIGLSRNTNCYIANTVKCRPPGNRNPQPDEISACVPFLTRQIKTLRPKIILTVGNPSTQTLLDRTEGITKLRGSLTVFRGTLMMDGDFNIPLLPTFHPSAVRREESLKAPVWEDMKTLRRKLCELDAEYAARMADIPL
ncbi:MAG: uracil-DNA glycosylase [Treponema sp.]|nr:uracil-DNA glycosylase [Treponema sp.]